MENIIEVLKQHVSGNMPDFGDGASVLSLLYEAYSESNRLDDAQTKSDFEELYRQMNGMDLREMDRIIYPVEGAIAVQCWGDNNTVTITNSKLICNYTTNAMYTSYCVALQSDGSYVAENNTFVIDNCAFQYSGVDNYNSVIKAAADIAGTNTVTVTNCTYGEKVVAE